MPDQVRHDGGDEFNQLISEQLVLLDGGRAAFILLTAADR
jgi:hypothetical protein